MKAKTKLQFTISLSSKECKMIVVYLEGNLQYSTFDDADQKKCIEQYIALLKNPLNYITK